MSPISEKHFTAWTGLAPGNPDSGKRKGHAKQGRDRIGRLFCMMAQSLVRSKDIALGGFYRRMAARRGGLIATMALARKMAARYWRTMVKGDDYVEQGLANYDSPGLATIGDWLSRCEERFVPIKYQADAAMRISIVRPH